MKCALTIPLSELHDFAREYLESRLLHEPAGKTTARPAEVPTTAYVERVKEVRLARERSGIVVVADCELTADEPFFRGGRRTEITMLLRLRCWDGRLGLALRVLDADAAWLPSIGDDLLKRALVKLLSIEELVVVPLSQGGLFAKQLGDLGLKPLCVDVTSATLVFLNDAIRLTVELAVSVAPSATSPAATPLEVPSLTRLVGRLISARLGPLVERLIAARG